MCKDADVWRGASQTGLLLILLAFTSTIGHAAATVSLSPTSLAFSDQLLNTTSTAQTETVKNTGTSTLTISSITIAGDFVVTSKSCGTSLAAGASCTVSVAFRPTASGSRTGTLTLNDNAVPTPQTVALSGNGAQSQAVSVAITPQTGCVGIAQSLQLKAVVSGVTNTAVTWAVDNVAGGNSTVGTISTAGLYAAPAVAGTHTIKATSASIPSKNSTIPVNVVSAVQVSVSPSNAAVLTSGTQQYTATVCGATSNTVTWTVDGVTGSAAAGSISSTGLYTAPGAAGTHTISARSTVDTTKSAPAKANVFSGITVDFGARALTTRKIPPNVIGTTLGFLGDQPTLNKMAGEGGIRTVKFYARIPDVFATTTASFGNIDPTIDKLKAIQTATGVKVRPIVMMTFTPTWLQPSPNPCNGVISSGYYAPPVDANINQWAGLAAQYVQHFDTKYPDFVQDYEIWNEPDLPSFCTPEKTDASRLAKYIKLYAAAASQMKSQAALDGKKIRVGGPALSNPVGLASEWVPKLVSDPSTAPNVDFVSYHLYLGNATAILAGMAWDTNDANVQSVYSRTQASWSIAGTFLNVSKFVKAGLQPNAASTPIYFDEYNDNSAFAKDCCRNSPTFSPVWNALTVADLLNTVYSGAQNVPAATAYYAASAPSYFCLFGAINADMNCATTAFTPYPQFYAFKLLAASTHLDLASGGTMAASISPAIPQVGLSITAFYTATRDSVLIVNPTSKAYTAVPLSIRNTGFAVPTGTQFLLNSTNQQITSSPLTLTPVTGGVNASVNVPAYSVVGVVIKQ